MNALILLSCLGGLALLAEIFNFRKALFPLVLAGLAGVIGLALMDWNREHIVAPIFKDMMVVNHFTIVFTVIMTATLFLWMLMSRSYFEEQSSTTDHYALVLFALTGGVVMASYNNMTMLFIGIEILSLSMYVLCGSNKADLGSNESAFKYFLMGSFATGFLLFGIALLYGATGSFDIGKVSEEIFKGSMGETKVLILPGILMMIIGMAFKVSAVPFHFWAPDVYQGAPTPITAYMSTIVKTAAFAAFYKLAFCFSGVSETWNNVVWGMAAATLLLSNITAVYQQNVKRMLAWSSISHAGYMLLAVLAMSPVSGSSVIYYTAAYSVGSIASFAVLMLVAKASNGNETFDSFNGLAKNNPILAFVMTLAMLSLAGIPPTAGFFAKYYIFTSAVSAGYTGLVCVAVLGSLISVYYYLRVIIAMYFKTSDTPEIRISGMQMTLLVIVTALIIALGIFPDLLLNALN
jgi:NADH-quinone oxidoreductase subunit N